MAQALAAKRTVVEQYVAPYRRCSSDTDSVPHYIIQMECKGASDAASGTWAHPIGRLLAFCEGV